MISAQITEFSIIIVSNEWWHDYLNSFSTYVYWMLFEEDSLELLDAVIQEQMCRKRERHYNVSLESRLSTHVEANG